MHYLYYIYISPIISQYLRKILIFNGILSDPNLALHPRVARTAPGSHNVVPAQALVDVFLAHEGPVQKRLG